MRMTADQIRQHDKIWIGRTTWVVQSVRPPQGGWVQMLITREGARQKLRLRLGQEWTVHRMPRGKLRR